MVRDTEIQKETELQRQGIKYKFLFPTPMFAVADSAHEQLFSLENFISPDDKVNEWSGPSTRDYGLFTYFTNFNNKFFYHTT